jgi:hypothetical protein
MYFYGCSYGHVNTSNRIREAVLLTTLCGTPCFNEFRLANMRSTEGPAQRKISQLTETKRLDDVPSDEAFLMANEDVDAASV